MKLILAMSLAALAVPLTSAMLVDDGARSPLLRLREASYHGVIDSWLVEEDGTVLLSLQTDAGKLRWFRTPANQSSTTQFELLALHAVMMLDDEPATAARGPVCVRGEGTVEDDGDSRDHAMQLVAIGRRR